MQDIEALLKEGKAVEIVPQGNSMHPLFESGRDKVTIEPVSIGARDIAKPKPVAKVGAVVLYRRPDEGILVLHRVYKTKSVNGEYVYYMIGDNQLEVEGPLEESCILGVMSSFIRKGHSYTVKNIRYRIFFGMWRLMTPIRGGVIRISKVFRKS